ncbi:MAG: DUF7550 family protein [Halobacteriota archaeon]|uniref:DUF7550 family protein n=1 Tax=Natronomonas sp. TaxID=2184060 RepID=UPI003974FE2F
MSEDADRDGDGNEGNEMRPYETERTTAPQSAYTGRDVAVGILVALVGVAVTFGVPLAVSL